jgi:hypothetical protein
MHLAAVRSFQPPPEPGTRRGQDRCAAAQNRVLVRIEALDHLVLTATDVEATVAFYERLGMRREVFGDGRIALRFGTQKLNLHPAGA